MRQTVLVIRFGSLGDVILSSATVLNLKLACPNSHLAYLTRDRFRPVVELFDGVDEVVTVSDRVYFRELLAVLLGLRDRTFDLVIDLHGNFRSWFSRSIVAARARTVYPKRRLERWRTTRRKKTLPAEYPHTIDLYNETLRKLGPPRPCRRPLLRPPALSPDYSRLFDTDQRAILVAPGAAHPNKAWPVERFAEVAERLHRSHQLRVLWAVTSDQVTARLSAVPDGAGPNLIELVDCPLDQLAAVIDRCHLVIANDSGVGHLATAVGTPLLSVFGPTHPVLGFAPRGLYDRVAQVDETCRPCSLHGRKACFREQRYCFTRIEAADLARTAGAMLDSQGARVPGLLVDRDGTLIVDKYYLADPDQVELIEGSAGALRAARSLGYKIIIVSNQSGVAKGYHTLDAVKQVNERLLQLLGAEGVQPDGVYFCPHHVSQGTVPEFSIECDCRKPSPGMAERAALELGLDLRKSVVVGDSQVDLGLGRVIGARPILVRTGYGVAIERDWRESLQAAAIPVVDDLRAAVEYLSRPESV